MRLGWHEEGIDNCLMLSGIMLATAMMRRLAIADNRLRVMMGGGIAAGTTRRVNVRLDRTRMMVGSWQQPASDQVGDERQVGEKPLHEGWPVKTARARYCCQSAQLQPARSYYYVTHPLR